VSQKLQTTNNKRVRKYHLKRCRSQEDGVFLVLDIEGLPDIPVSKSYTEKITQIFSQQS